NEKPSVPMGDLGHNLLGESLSFESSHQHDTSYRAILDIGLLDVDDKHVKLINRDLKIVGASSDMIVVDLGTNEKNYQIGDLLEFEMDYMGILRIMNSRYIEKRIDSGLPEDTPVK